MRVRKKGTLERRRRMKAEEAMRRANRNIERQEDRPAASTAKSRQRMANALLITGAVTSICWVPYIICVTIMTICSNENDDIMKISKNFALFLGHAHSVINPIVYWAINRESLTRCTCPCPCSCLKRVRLPRSNPFRHNNNSSTNEMALGPFNPRFIKPPIPNLRRHSSCYLY